MPRQEIRVGRDGNTNTLKISTNGKEATGGPIPRSVSREHCLIVREDDGTAVITNLNDRNVTYVNGQPVKTASIGADDVVELGGEHYKLDTAFLKLAKVVSISHLERIWNSFNEWEEQQKIGNIRSAALKSVTGLFSMAAIIITFGDFGMEEGTVKTVRIFLYALAAISIGWTGINMFVSAPRKVRETKAVEEKFIDTYICPACKKSFGKTYRYERLVQLGECPLCKAKFKEGKPRG